jgi:predicted RNase H-like HicB family nuclease
MEEITLQVEPDEESGWLVAWWDDPDGAGGITTQGRDLSDLQHQITEAVTVHFDEAKAPQRIRLHFVGDPVLVRMPQPNGVGKAVPVGSTQYHL